MQLSDFRKELVSSDESSWLGSWFTMSYLPDKAGGMIWSASSAARQDHRGVKEPGGIFHKVNGTEDDPEVHVLSCL